MDGDKLRRENADLRRQIKLLTQRLAVLKLRRDNADLRRHVKILTQRLAVLAPPHDGVAVIDDLEFDGGLQADCVHATFDSFGLFTIDGIEVDLPPSSGNPIYDDYADDEIDLAASLEDPVYDVYDDEEIDPTSNSDSLIYEDYDIVEEVIVKCAMVDVRSILKWRESFFATCMSDTE